VSYGCSTARLSTGWRGCSREFGSLRAFDHHFIPSDDMGPASCGERCRTDAELEAVGIVRFPDGTWRDAAEARRRAKAYPASGAGPRAEVEADSV